jgi:TonB family protein
MLTMKHHRFVIINVVVVVLGATAVFGQTAATFVPARRLAGSLPLTPATNVVAWIEETVEATVDVSGRVAGVRPLRASPLPTDPLAPAVGDWQFRPAVDGDRVIPSRVLVAAIFRPAQLNDAPTLGNPPVVLAAPSDEIPFPLVTAPPPYPTLAIGEGVVLVELLVGADGGVRQSQIVTGASAFDRAALETAARWAFRPARWNGRAVEAYAYLVFGFRQPVVAAPLNPAPAR